MAERPPHVKAPAYLTPSPPVPDPAAAKEATESGGPKGKEPTRYGDWENKGIAWDF
ncbi:MAG TPA: DUF1674 domain-containing protein [Allosphingosinicella sp.]|nr:DUF1674 domain-containing protein [Allosphingosinicella sp.]